MSVIALKNINKSYGSRVILSDASFNVDHGDLALIRKPKIILADEPTGALDESAESDILEILQALNRSGVTIAMVTHNQVVANICKKLYSIVDGKIVPV
ncbi:hypothetical protein JDW19_00635 [Paenibacillus polymyxa]|uniref:ABC transporter ATP-binding protein n=1 Tax=Paenibacillus polymyxa TaxID=1406 RepID=A0A8I1LNS1_PAEPO|nr:MULTISPECIES: hypothetical protein [Paenibacillus]KAF6576890.1 hypothetical protein G9G53_03035 [Paenibacillus sp. EKM206P]KAF6590923.1 hypothetical protein G9G52_00630 [Paenibacillus sp. EKM205P]MBM0631646.1 hypothetical protein [Paenibacillus polymyxa]